MILGFSGKTEKNMEIIIYGLRNAPRKYSLTLDPDPLDFSKHIVPLK